MRHLFFQLVNRDVVSSRGREQKKECISSPLSELMEERLFQECIFGWNVLSTLLPSLSNNNVLLLFPRDDEESSPRAPIFTESRNLLNGRIFSFR
ncbi:hypothetical protein CEXT_489271 [Caerostris extrusa]|uniref:Maturase K n=1 Tax=Caerostris extrusa TaxID=172846 RepID=A0AAV4UZL8_CAEEX|nr:hypothetical protein CEXT_489271 [Caerostris extrusa]